MKKLTSILFTLLISATICDAQMKTGITTEEEYNYMTKGYQMQLSSGLDMKKGYMLGTTVSIKDHDYSFNFMPLQKVGTDTILVGYIVKARFPDLFGATTQYYGIPYGDDDLLNRCFNSISTLNAPFTQALFKAYVKLQTHLY